MRTASRWVTLAGSLLTLACLSGCASSEPAGDPPTDLPSAAEAAGEPPSDYDAPPLGKPRAKKLPGDVPEEAEPANDEADEADE